MKMEVLVQEYHEDFLEVGDSGLVESSLVVSESVPHRGEWGHYQVDNGHPWVREGEEGRWKGRGRKGREGEREEGGYRK